LEALVFPSAASAGLHALADTLTDCHNHGGLVNVDATNSRYPIGRPSHDPGDLVIGWPAFGSASLDARRRPGRKPR
jgi:hypothetical protein